MPTGEKVIRGQVPDGNADLPGRAVAEQKMDHSLDELVEVFASAGGPVPVDAVPESTSTDCAQVAEEQRTAADSMILRTKGS